MLRGLQCVLRDLQGVLRGLQGVLRGLQRVLRGLQCVLTGLQGAACQTRDALLSPHRSCLESLPASGPECLGIRLGQRWFSG